MFQFSRNPDFRTQIQVLQRSFGATAPHGKNENPVKILNANQSPRSTTCRLGAPRLGEVVGNVQTATTPQFRETPPGSRTTISTLFYTSTTTIPRILKRSLDRSRPELCIDINRDFLFGVSQMLFGVLPHI